MRPRTRTRLADSSHADLSRRAFLEGLAAQWRSRSPSPLPHRHPLPFRAAELGCRVASQGNDLAGAGQVDAGQAPGRHGSGHRRRFPRPHHHTGVAVRLYSKRVKKDNNKAIKNRSWAKRFGPFRLAASCTTRAGALKKPPCISWVRNTSRTSWPKSKRKAGRCRNSKGDITMWVVLSGRCGAALR